MAAALPHHRRDRCSSAHRRPGRGPGQRLVPRPTRLERQPRAVRRRARRVGPAGDRLRGRAHARWSLTRTGTGRPGRAPYWHNDLYDGQTIDARLPRPTLARTRAYTAPPGPACTPVDFDDAKLTPYIGPPVVPPGGDDLPAGLDLTRGPTLRRLRPEPGRLGPRHGSGATRATRSRCATPRSSSTASSAPVRCARAEATDRFILQRRRRRVRADLHVPRVPLRRGRRLAGRARRRRPASPSSCDSDLRRDRQLHAARTRC